MLSIIIVTYRKKGVSDPASTVSLSRSRSTLSTVLQVELNTGEQLNNSETVTRSDTLHRLDRRQSCINPLNLPTNLLRAPVWVQSMPEVGFYLPKDTPTSFEPWVPWTLFVNISIQNKHPTWTHRSFDASHFLLCCRYTCESENNYC